MAPVDKSHIELIHPVREGRSDQQIGKKGISNHHWIIGGKLCLLLNHLGMVYAWDCATANAHDSHFHPMIARFEGKTVVFADHGFYSLEENPSNMKICQRYTHSHVIPGM